MNSDSRTAARAAIVSLGARTLTSVLALACEPKRAYCNDCSGKGFDLTREPGKRSSRKCPRCRGAGSFEVGSTKR